MGRITIQNRSHLENDLINAEKGGSFWKRLRGLMFTAPIPYSDGLLMVGERENRMDAAIHMFFVNYNLGIIWMDRQKKVVDTCLALSWHPFYMPGKPAKYILEVHPGQLKHIHIGDQLEFNDQD